MHHNYYLDSTVDVFIVTRIKGVKKVLLRLHDKYNKWLPVGGHIDPGEDTNAAALREVLDEVGLTVSLYGRKPEFDPASVGEGFRSLVPPEFMNVHPISATHKHMSHIYFAHSTSFAVSPQDQSDRSDTWYWFSLDELRAGKMGDESVEIDDATIEYAARALDKVDC